MREDRWRLTGARSAVPVNEGCWMHHDRQRLTGTPSAVPLGEGR